MKILFARLSILILVISSCAEARAFQSVPGELIVKLKSETQTRSASDFHAIANSLQKYLGVRSLVTVRKLMTTSRYAVLKVSEAQKAKAILLLNQDARVAYAEPNFIYHTLEGPDYIPNDPDFSSLWGLRNTGQAEPEPSGTPGAPGVLGADIHVASVWGEGITGSKKIRIAVIDTGIDYTHPELKDNVDAASGFNFVNNTANAMDDQNHGSHCSGTIGAIANNGIGVAGINWNVTMIPIKFLDSSGSGTADRALQAIQYATQLGVNVMSNSWGGGGFSQALLDAITEAKNKGILFVVAAGNDSSDNDLKPTYPANYSVDNVIAVAATDHQDKIASFSNFGRSTVHIAAPGVNILSTFMGGGYGILSGTSMATPHISGMAALLWSVHPSYSYAQIKDTLLQSCDKIRGLSHKVACGGRANIYNAVHGVFPKPSDPPEKDWKDVQISFQSPHPYENSQVYSFPIQVPNAKYIRVVFDAFSTEAGYDFVHVKQANGDEIETLSGMLPGYVSDYLIGDHAEVVLTTDSSVTMPGIVVSHVQAIY